MPHRLPSLPDTLTVLAAVAGVAAILLVQGYDQRVLSNTLGVVVFGLLLWRLVSTWPQLTRLEHALAVLLTLSPLITTMASLALLARTTHLPDNPMLWLVVAHRCACILLVAFWCQVLGRRDTPVYPSLIGSRG